MARDDDYREIVLAPLREAMRYRPQMGTGKAVALPDFLSLYATDPLYHWMGLDNELMYLAAKAGGGQTSIYRHLGDGMERLVRRIFMDEYHLTEAQANWGYVITEENGTKTHRQLDGRLDLNMVDDQTKKQILADWLGSVKKAQGTQFDPQGAVFEVRQGYKSQDSKRAKGDITNGSHALNSAYQMFVMVMSMQIPNTVRNRYERSNICVMTGNLEDQSPLTSTYAFFSDVVGYNLAEFFDRNSGVFRKQTHAILTSILENR